MARRRRETNAEIATTTPERRGNRTPDFLRPNEEPAAKVADAEQRSAAATSSDADTPTTTVTATATKNGDAADDDLRDRLASLQTMVEQLVAAQVSPVATSGDPEVDSASRTLRFAQQTADSVIAEAREEALAIVADAERQRSEIIRRARQQADQDYTAERDEILAASAAWQAQRAEILDQLDALTGVFGRYREGLTDLDSTVEAVGTRLRTGTAAEPIVIASAANDAEPVGDDESDGRSDGTTVDHASADDTAAEVADAEVVEPADSDDPVVEAVGDVTNEGDVIDLTRRNPFTRAPVSKVQKIDADTDPFVFDVAELPETTGDFGWETDPVDGPDGATTF